jgi:hypothetical protein
MEMSHLWFFEELTCMVTRSIPAPCNSIGGVVYVRADDAEKKGLSPEKSYGLQG